MNDNNPDFNQDVDYSRRGPWDAPLSKIYKDSPIVVLIYDLKAENGDFEQKFELNYGAYEDRKFLGKLTFWALTTGRSVETMLKDEWEKMK